MAKPKLAPPKGADLAASDGIDASEGLRGLRRRDGNGIYKAFT